MTELPLSRRVTALEAVIPTVDGLAWRAATVDDIDAVTDLLHAAERVDHPRYLTPRDEVANEFTSSFVDLTRDSLVGADGSGELVACGLNYMPPGQETLVRVILEGTVHPRWRRRGVGAQVLAWQERRATQQLAASDKTLPGWLMFFMDAEDAGRLALAASAGFAVARHYFELRRSFDAPIPDLPLPEGFRIAHPEPAQYEALRLAKNDAFRDHWGSQPASAEEWEGMMGMSVLRPDLSFVVTAPNGEVAGFVLTEVDENDWEGQGFSSGYIELVGVPRAYRGLHIAPAMLAATLRAIQAAGLEKAVLDVDSENPSGALPLYQGVGFAQEAASLSVTKVF